MMMIDLKTIRDDWDACYDDDRLASLFSQPRSVMDVLTLQDGPWADVPPQDRLWVVLREKCITARALRLFACWCAEQALALVDNPDPRSVAAIEVSRRYADGKATEAELVAAKDAAVAAAMGAAMGAARAAARAAAVAAARAAARAAAMGAAWDAQVAAWDAQAAAMGAARDALVAAMGAARDAQVAHLIQMLDELAPTAALAQRRRCVMRDLELRKQVAEAVGWTNVRIKPNRQVTGTPLNTDRKYPPYEIPAYDTDIAAAWSLRPDGAAYLLTDDGAGHHCMFTDGKGCKGSATALTAPHAICLAYLAWCEVK